MVLTRAQRAQRARHGHEDDNARHARQWSWPLAADEREHDEPVPLRPLRRRNAPRNAPQPPPQPRPPRAVAQAQARAQPVRLLGLPRYWAIALMLLASIASSLLWLPLWRDSALCCPDYGVSGNATAFRPLPGYAFGVFHCDNPLATLWFPSRAEPNIGTMVTLPPTGSDTSHDKDDETQEISHDLIKNHYNALVKIWHPDRGRRYGIPPRIADAAFRQLKRAKESLDEGNTDWSELMPNVQQSRRSAGRSAGHSTDGLAASVLSYILTFASNVADLVPTMPGLDDILYSLDQVAYWTYERVTQEGRLMRAQREADEAQREADEARRVAQQAADEAREREYQELLKKARERVYAWT